ncbi:MAG: tetratricopeptide repeat protein [Bacteroidota bacterium]
MKLTKGKLKSFLETDNSEYRNSIINDSSFDEFDQDVIDGLGNSELVSSDFKNLDKKYYRFSFSKLILSISLIVIIIASISILLTSKSNTEKIAENYAKPASQDKKSNFEKDLINKQHIDPQRDTELVKNPVEENKKQIQKTSDKSVENSNNTTSTSSQTSSSMSTLNPKIINNENSKNLVGTLGIEVFILNYKTLDYRHYRKSKPKTNDPLELTNGTPANSSGKNELNSEIEEIEYNYFSYLKEAMKLFDQKSFVLAAENFNAILITYPEDINALFYGGLCSFEQKQFIKSVALFDQARKSAFLNFKEEAEWLLLQSYSAMNDREKAKQIRNEIINGDGFYAKRAKEMKID